MMCAPIIMSRRMLEVLIWGFRVYADAKQSRIFPELYATPGGA